MNAAKCCKIRKAGRQRQDRPKPACKRNTVHMNSTPTADAPNQHRYASRNLMLSKCGQIKENDTQVMPCPYNLFKPVLGPKSPRLYLLRSYPAFLNFFSSHVFFFSNSSDANLFLTEACASPFLSVAPVSFMILLSAHDHENSRRRGCVWLFGWMAENGFLSENFRSSGVSVAEILMSEGIRSVKDCCAGRLDGIVMKGLEVSTLFSFSSSTGECWVPRGKLACSGETGCMPLSRPWIPKMLLWRPIRGTSDVLRVVGPGIQSLSGSLSSVVRPLRLTFSSSSVSFGDNTLEAIGVTLAFPFPFPLSLASTAFASILVSFSSPLLCASLTCSTRFGGMAACISVINFARLQ